MKPRFILGSLVLAALVLASFADTTQVPPVRGTNSIILQYVNTIPPPLPNPEIGPSLRRITADLWLMSMNTNHVILVTNKPVVEQIKGGYQIHFNP